MIRFARLVILKAVAIRRRRTTCSVRICRRRARRRRHSRRPPPPHRYAFICISRDRCFEVGCLFFDDWCVRSNHQPQQQQQLQQQQHQIRGVGYADTSTVDGVPTIAVLEVRNDANTLARVSRSLNIVWLSSSCQQFGMLLEALDVAVVRHSGATLVRTAALTTTFVEIAYHLGSRRRRVVDNAEHVGPGARSERAVAPGRRDRRSGVAAQRGRRRRIAPLVLSTRTFIVVVVVIIVVVVLFLVCCSFAIFCCLVAVRS
jgi:hypothetical protein